MDTAELLETTADRFESGVYEWTRLDLVNENGEYCSIGALSYTAIGQVSYEVEEVRKAAAAMMNVANRGMAKTRKTFVRARGTDEFFAKWAESVVARWNDIAAKDKAEVVEVMKQAAKNLRNEA